MSVRLALVHYRAAVDLGLRGRAAIVTGATRGIGRRIALDLAGEGCRVLVCARDDAAGQALAREIVDAGGRAAAVAVDITEPEAAGALVDACVRTLGRLDILVNNAGSATPKPLEQLTDADWRAGMELNFLAAARLLKANGAPGDMGGALRHYNRSTRYVRAVSAYARTMTRSRSAYRGYWHWRVLYRHTRGTYVLPVGYPKVRPVLLRAG